MMVILLTVLFSLLSAIVALLTWGFKNRRKKAEIARKIQVRSYPSTVPSVTQSAQWNIISNHMRYDIHTCCCYCPDVIISGRISSARPPPLPAAWPPVPKWLLRARKPASGPLIRSLLIPF